MNIKIKKSYVSLGLLVLILTLTIIGTLNQSVEPKYKPDSPKSSAGEITIITPENKTYMEPDSGYYPATFGFENDLIGDNPYGWSTSEPGLQNIEIISSLDGHNNVLELFDTEVGSGAIAQANNSFASQVSGTIEFWYRIGGTQEDQNFRVLEGGNYGIFFGLRSGNFQYYNISGWHSLAPGNSDQWYHIRFDFDCTSDTYDFYLDNVLIQSNLEFYTLVNSLNKIEFITRQWGTSSDYYSYVDALGYSWDPNYNIGDNLYEGLLLSYENTTTLDWKGYSLDEQSNKTIMGNTTIPIPIDGVHSIQVFGNNSLGTMFESNPRYFTTNALDPEITIDSPISNQLYGIAPPDFSLSIPDPDLDATWYSLDDGTTNIPFSGLTGTIDQTEWDKIGNGTVTITFYANDTINNIGQAEVTIRKDILAPLITVNSPVENQVFGENAPSFDLTILEQEIDATWYTLDYGSVNVSFSGSAGTIDQTEWAKKGGGTIPIRFYANDSLGNVDFSEVIVVKDLISPIISINSPSNNELFGSAPPNFDITVIESNPDLMWYTLDSGATNVTFGSSTGTIDQTEWSNQGNGTVTIRFYAEDEAGNVGFEEIIIRKDVNIPLITINSPTTNDIFGIQAPQYDVSVVESNIDSMWYTLDNGITTTSFTEFTGTIDQTEWEKFGDGIVIIRFYVRDKSDNEAFAEVSINKDLIAPVITINEPEFGEVFVDIAPLYSITIDETSLDSYWYSLDGGQTNHTISELTGAIDQAAWDSLSDGHLTLIFYAEDEAGNVGQSSMTITKRTTPVPIPPGISGYDLYLLIGALSVISAFIIGKRLKS